MKLAAIDLSPIGKACSSPIDGILGVDLLDKMGVSIDPKHQVASLATSPADPKLLFDLMETHICITVATAFEQGSSTVDQVFAEEFECALARQARGLRRVVLALVAIETVSRVVEEHRQFRMRPLDFFNFGRWDVLISAAKMQYDGGNADLQPHMAQSVPRNSIQLHADLAVWPPATRAFRQNSTLRRQLSCLVTNCPHN